MSKNLNEVLDQFGCEGLDGDWYAKYVEARKELAELEAAYLKLNALERAGVDNWEGYDYAMEEFRDFRVDKQL